MKTGRESPVYELYWSIGRYDLPSLVLDLPLSKQNNMEVDTPLKWKLVKQPCRRAVSLARRGTFRHGAVPRKYYLLSSDLAIFFQNVRDCVVNSTRTGWLTAAYEFAYTSTWSNL